MSSAYQYMEDYEKAQAELRWFGPEPGEYKSFDPVGYALGDQEDWKGALEIWEQVASLDDVEEFTREFARSQSLKR